MKMKWLIMPVIFSLLAGCGAAENMTGDRQEIEADEGEYVQITQEEAKTMMGGQDVIVVDVRTQEEYEKGHIEGAVLVPNETITDVPPEELPEDATLLIYCRSGNRSRQAAQKLAAMGYEHVYEFGGINDWPYEIITDGESAQMPNVEDQKAGGKDQAEMTGEFARFSSTDLDGNRIDQSVIAGADLTMLNIWGTYCGPCIREMPELGELAEEYADSGVQIIGVPVDVYNESGIATALEIIDKTGADYLHILATQDLYDIILNDVSAVPTTIFIDGNGTVLKTAVGAKSKDEWKTLIEDLRSGL